LSLPARLKLRDGVGKWVLRKAIADRVPAEVFQRPKQGFDVPLRHWFRRELSYRLDELLNPSSSIYAYASHAAVTRIVNEHRTGRRDHARVIWRLLVLERWSRNLATGEAARDFTVSRDVGALMERAASEGALVSQS
jgi:asparagine synthase (glutamine-hydrolysing)